MQLTVINFLSTYITSALLWTTTNVTKNLIRHIASIYYWKPICNSVAPYIYYPQVRDQKWSSLPIGPVDTLHIHWMFGILYLFGCLKDILPGLKNATSKCASYIDNLPCKIMNLKQLFQTNTLYIPLMSGTVQADKFYYLYRYSQLTNLLY